MLFIVFRTSHNSHSSERYSSGSGSHREDRNTVHSNRRSQEKHGDHGTPRDNRTQAPSPRSYHSRDDQEKSSASLSR